MERKPPFLQVIERKTLHHSEALACSRILMLICQAAPSLLIRPECKKTPGPELKR
jgi:hypothetical protein